VVEEGSQTWPGALVQRERAPVEQEVVEVERVRLALPLPVAAEDGADLVAVRLAPGDLIGQHL
jgi:hypothetical protein